MRRLSRLVAVTITALFSLALLAVPASAQYPPAQPDNGVGCTPEAPAPGEGVSCASDGWQPNSTVNYTITSGARTGNTGSSVIASGSAVADGNGRVMFSFTVPSDAPAGLSFGVVASGTATDGSPRTASDVVSAQTGGGDDGDDDGGNTGGDDSDDGVTPVTDSDDGGLARTGLESSTILAIAFGGVAIGGALLVAGRRRSTVDA